MKKLVSLVMVFAMCACLLAGCGSSSSAPAATDAPQLPTLPQIPPLLPVPSSSAELAL